MGSLSVIWRFASSWYVSTVVAVALGIVLGYFIFFEVFPSKPKIGIIDIPFTVLDDNSAFVITAFLEFAREDDDIKGVVIRLNSPGSAGSAADQLYLKTRELRQEKPVVVAMADLTASGAYLWSLGANYTYATPTSWVGSIGVFLASGRRFPSIPEVPDERVLRTGPRKFIGGSQRDFLGLLDQLKNNFAQMVITERGDKLRLSREELLEARIYNGNEGVRLGLVDAIGGEMEATQKVASLAGISDYELVDINTEVFRRFNQKLWRILEPLEPLLASSASEPGLTELRTLLGSPVGTGDATDPLNDVTRVEMLRRILLPSGVGQIENELSDFSVGINTPRIYYLYVGPSQ